MYLTISVVVALSVGVTYGDLVHSCLPDGTVQVTNPNLGLYSHVFAVQDEGVSAAVKCSVSTSGAESNITGCSQDNTIVVWFSNQAGSVDTFAGTSFISYEVQCNDLLSGGADKTVVNNLAANIEVTTQDIVTPSFVVSSELRSVNQLGSPVSSATVGDTIYWTIDIPAEYSALMMCGAFSGYLFGSPDTYLIEDGKPKHVKIPKRLGIRAVVEDSPNNFLLTLQDILNPGLSLMFGCAVDYHLMGSNFDNIETGVYGIKRYWGVVYVFKFYNSNDVVFACYLYVCPSGSSACDINCSKRKRSAGAVHHTGPDDKTFSTSQMLHILPGPNSAVAILGTLWRLVVGAGVLILLT